MLPVDIGIGHQDDLVVAKFCDIEIIMDTCTKGCDEGLDFIVLKYSIDARLLNIEDLSANRKDSLITRVAATFCGAACGISLDDIKLALLWLSPLAISEFSRHSAPFEKAFTAS